MKNYSIAEDFVLPSKGEVYAKEIDPNYSLRSMTTLEEKKRLSIRDLPYKVLAEIIDDCTVDKKDIKAYDLIVGDFQYLLYKLRTVTYGNDYKVTTRCPLCGKVHEETVDLDALDILYTENAHEKLTVELPVSKSKVKINLLTPRILDEVNRRAKEITEKSKDYKSDPKFTLSLEALINEVEGEKLSPGKLTRFVEDLPMRDVRVLNSSAEKIKFGLDTAIQSTCPFCLHDYTYELPFNGEFFGPTYD